MVKKSNSIIFIHHARFYYNLVKASLNESIKHKNQWVVLIDDPNDKDEYNRKTTWSDFNIIIPILFCFLHALELTLKGLIYHRGETPKKTHKLIELYENFKQLFPKENKFFDILEFYIKPSDDSSILVDFFLKNKIDINMFSDSLRYPTDKNNSKFRTYLSMLYQDRKAITFFKKTLFPHPEPPRSVKISPSLTSK